jgi:opacity protein-like surface antigen
MIRTFVRGLAATLALLVVVTVSAGAQMASSSRFGVNAGVALPMGDFGDAVGLGIHAGGHVMLPLGEKLKLRINGDFGTYGGDVSGLDNITLLGAVANVMVPITTSSALKPYLFGGLGYYQAKANIVGGGSVDNSELAFNVGAGYDWGTKFFTEIRFLSIQTDGSSTTTLPITVGLRF